MINKFTFLSIIIFSVLFLSACSNSDEGRFYTGESDNWEATYWEGGELIIKYVGEEPLPSENVNYIVKYGQKTREGNRPLIEGVLEIDETFSGNGNGHNDIEVTINWEMHSEVLKLENN